MIPMEIYGIILFFILFAIGLLIFLANCGRAHQAASTGGEGVSQVFGKAKMAFWLKLILDIFLVMGVVSVITVFVLVGRDLSHQIRYGEPGGGYGIPFTFRVTDVQMWERGKSEEKRDAVVYQAEGNIEIQTPTASYLFISYAAASCAYFMVLIVVLRNLFKSLSIKQVFIRENVTRLRTVGFATIFFELIQGFIKLMCNQYIHTHYEFEMIDNLYSLNCFRVEIFFVAFSVLIIAEVFRCGVEMKEEQDLTV